MTRWMEPAEYKAKQSTHQIELLDEIITALTKVYRHQIGRIRSTEKTELARGQLYTCIQNLMDERNHRAKNVEMAAAQVQSQQYERRLLEAGTDCIDAESWEVPEGQEF